MIQVNKIMRVKIYVLDDDKIVINNDNDTDTILSIKGDKVINKSNMIDMMFKYNRSQHDGIVGDAKE
jgi:hypothetical protein